MKTLDQAAKECKFHSIGNEDHFTTEQIFRYGVAFAQQWISIEDELPDITHEVKDESEIFFYSDYVLIKVKGYEHPFVGYYVKANDDEFFDFIHASIDNEIDRNDIIEWRPIEIK